MAQKNGNQKWTLFYCFLNVLSVLVISHPQKRRKIILVKLLIARERYESANIFSETDWKHVHRASCHVKSTSKTTDVSWKQQTKKKKTSKNYHSPSLILIFTPALQHLSAENDTCALVWGIQLFPVALSGNPINPVTPTKPSVAFCFWISLHGKVCTDRPMVKPLLNLQF